MSNSLLANASRGLGGAAFLGCVCTAWVLGGVAGAPPTAALPTGDALAGPAVKRDEVAKATGAAGEMSAMMGGKGAGGSLVVKSFHGGVEMPRPTPEEAALGLLTLSAEEKAATAAMLGKRRRVLEEFISRNLDLLTKLGVAFGGTDKTDQANLLVDAAAELRPLWAQGPLQDSLRKCLTPGNSAMYDRLLQEFWSEFSAAKMQIKKDDGGFPNKFEVMTGAKLESLGKEIEATFGQMLASGSFAYRLLFDGVELEGEQRIEISEFVETFIEQTQDEADEIKFPRLIGLLLPKLTTDQQRSGLMGNVGRLSRGEITIRKKDGQGKETGKETGEQSGK